jgi:beta-N-acetylhexosaminidase
MSERRVPSGLGHVRAGRRALVCASVLFGLLVVPGAVGQPEGGAGGHEADGRVMRRAPEAAGSPTVRELVGQRLVVAMQGTSPSAPLLARIRNGEIGGVILFGGNVESRSQLVRSVAVMQEAARSSGRPALLIATDQEGGRIRRLAWAGPLPTTTELGRLGRDRVQAEALTAGRQLRAAGVNVDLAPVADVPAVGSFMALEHRTFAATAAGVATASTAFARGLAAARVAAAVKHFPGIGRATRNTDRAAVAIPAGASALGRRDLIPFRKAIAERAPIVMISNATYPALDAKPAPWSPRIQALLRRELGFEGVTITDALEGAAATRGRTVAAVASLAAQAGIDLLLLTGSEASSDAAYERVVRAAEQGRIPVAALRASYERILALKRVYG